MTNKCQAMPTRENGFRCAKCRTAWDAGDAPPCPRLVAERAHDEDLARSDAYVSALPPVFVDNLQ
jgi:hypothetical protein